MNEPTLQGDAPTLRADASVIDPNELDEQIIKALLLKRLGRVPTDEDVKDPTSCRAWLIASDRYAEEQASLLAEKIAEALAPPVPSVTEVAAGSLLAERRSRASW